MPTIDSNIPDPSVDTGTSGMEDMLPTDSSNGGDNSNGNGGSGNSGISGNGGSAGQGAGSSSGTSGTH
jgi:hypothetical protein